MSDGLYLLLKDSFEYERSHQLVLATLLAHSKTFCFELLGYEWPIEVQVEGDRMDLLITTAGGRKGFVEIKLRSTLYDNQIVSHRKFIEEQNAIAHYLLLGYSSFEYNQQDLEKEIHPNARRLSYEELESALEALLSNSNELAGVKEIAVTYQQLLNQDRSRSRDTTSNKSNHRLHHYSVFSEIKKHLKMNTRMYDAGFSRIVLNPWDVLHSPVTINGLSGKLFFEIENSRVVFKFYVPSDDLKIKDRLRELILEECTTAYPFLRFKKGRKPTKLKPKDEKKDYPHFTACSTTSHDFADLSQIEKSAKFFTEIYDRFEGVRQRILIKL